MRHTGEGYRSRLRKPRSECGNNAVLDKAYEQPHLDDEQLATEGTFLEKTSHKPYFQDEAGQK